MVLLAVLFIYALRNIDRKQGGPAPDKAPLDTINNNRDTLQANRWERPSPEISAPLSSNWPHISKTVVSTKKDGNSTVH